MGQIKDPRRKRRGIPEESRLAVLALLLVLLALPLGVVADHGRDLRRKRRGMHPKGFKPCSHDGPRSCRGV